MSEKLLSIIIPVYKTEAYIHKCVDSVLCQTYKNLEIILVDDGSPDNCPVICEEYAAKDSRIKVIHKQNEGLFKAVKDGVIASTGQYLGFVDSDDWVEPNMFDILMTAIIQDKSDISVSSFVLALPDCHEKNKLRLKSGVYEGENLENEIFKKLIHKNVIFDMRWNKVFKRELFLNNLDYCLDILHGEDVVRVIPAVLDAKKISVLTDDFLYYYRYNTDSITKLKYKPLMTKSYRDLYLSIEHSLKDKGREDLINNLKLCYGSLVMLALNNELRSGLPKNEVKAKLHEIMSDKITQESLRLFRKEKEHSFKTRMVLSLAAGKKAGLYYFIKKKRVK